MKVLTIKEPWVTCILHHGKRTENRTWPPPAAIIGQRIAIHASKKLDERAGCISASQLAGVRLSLVQNKFYCGHIAGTVVVAGYVKVLAGGRVDLTRAPADYDPDSDKWLVKQTGNYGWILADIELLKAPIPAVGKLGLWEWDCKI